MFYLPLKKPVDIDDKLFYFCNPGTLKRLHGIAKTGQRQCIEQCSEIEYSAVLCIGTNRTALHFIKIQRTVV